MTVLGAEQFERELGALLPSMWALGWRLAGPDAEDVVAEALLQAWRNRAGYDPQRGSLKTWLLVIVADRCRKRARRLSTRPQDTALPEGLAAVRDETRELPGVLDLDRAVARLPPRQRLAVELHYVLGLDVNETALIMRCAAGTARSTLHAARAALRPLLEVQP